MSQTIDSNAHASFERKHLDITYTLGSEKFDDRVSDTVTLTRYRTAATVSRQAGSYQGSLQLRIWGLTQSMMNRMSVLASNPDVVRKNDTVTVVARSGDDDPGSTVYSGTVNNAWADYSGAPDVPMQITAFGALAIAANAAAPSSYKGSVDAADILSGMAAARG